jgi:glycine betaine/choline ABC-type transport system substrate-binding protein
MLNASSTSTTKDQLEQLCNAAIDNTQDFTDSIYISIEQREKVLQYHQKLQDHLIEINKLISEVRIQQQNDSFTIAIQTIQQIAREFRQQVNSYSILNYSK